MATYVENPNPESKVEAGEPVTIKGIGKNSAIGRMPAFAGLAKATGGLYVEDPNGMTIDEALDKAGLDFTVESVEGVQVPVVTDDGVTNVVHPQYRMNVARHADGSVTPVGMVKGRYQIVQNREAYAFAEIMLGEGGANIAAAGKYGSPMGSRTYLALMLEPFDVAGDKHQMYVTIINSHDGATGLRALLAPLRLDCTNQVTATFGRKAPNQISLRHTGHIEGRITEARDVLGLAERWEANFKKAAERLLDQKMSVKQFTNTVDQLWTPPAKDASKRTVTVADNRRDALVALFANASTNEFGRNTRYGAYNAITEYLDWYAPVRGGDSPEITRYVRTLDGGKDSKKEQAFAMLMPKS